MDKSNKWIVWIFHFIFWHKTWNTQENTNAKKVSEWFLWFLPKHWIPSKATWVAFSAQYKITPAQSCKRKQGIKNMESDSGKENQDVLLYHYSFLHLCTKVSSVTSSSDVVQILPTRAQPGVHVGHLALHELWGRKGFFMRTLPRPPTSLIPAEAMRFDQSNLKVSDLLSKCFSDVHVGNRVVQNRLHDPGKWYLWSF